MGPSIALFFLAPWVGEYLNGNTSIEEIAALPILGLLYGGGALVIREVARRAGRGWPTIILLGGAYGVIESGLVDTSAFNHQFEGLDFSLMTIPGIGVSIYWFPYFVFIHAVWSISVPIALVEALVPRRRTTPWLGNAGLGVVVLLYLSGAAFIGWYLRTEEGFRIAPGEYAGMGLFAATLIVAAFTVRIPRRTVNLPVPTPIVIGAATFLWSSLWSVIAITVMWYADRETPVTWMGWAAEISLVATGVVALVRVSRRAGWGDEHRLAVAGGLLLMYAWGAFAVARFTGRTDAIDLIGHGVFAGVAVALLIGAASMQRESQRGRSP